MSLDGDVVLQIDEALGALVSRGHAPERPQSAGRNGICLWAEEGARALRKPAFAAASRPRGMTVRQRVGARSKRPFTAPAVTIDNGERSGTKVASDSS